MTPTELMLKAQRALSSAQTLLNDGDVDGACNRAYYAMFDAARAALSGQKFQFERHGYFVADRVEHGDDKAVFNKITGLKDTWGK